jgi:hypothetical protein
MKQAATDGRKRGETEEGSGCLPAVDNGRWWVDKRSGEGPFYRRAFGGKIGVMAALARGVMQQGRAATGDGCEREAAPAVCVNDTQCRALVACGLSGRQCSTMAATRWQHVHQKALCRQLCSARGG